MQTKKTHRSRTPRQPYLFYTLQIQATSGVVGLHNLGIRGRREILRGLFTQHAPSLRL